MDEEGNYGFIPGVCSKDERRFQHLNWPRKARALGAA